MNTILGARIRTLRESKGFTQEQIADKMNCTRQEYARIEKGLIDISYAGLKAIAKTLNVKIDEITSSVSSVHEEQPIFGSNTDLLHEDKFEYISNMIDTFYAHRNLYNRVKLVNLDEYKVKLV